ncbi:SGNH/GDSL hydrolase family protein [Agrilactobacillus composti]|uniref:SGNH/GDSL hydrolase family protein n=1 Tax=Agrilactobacillus composti TaxID=398555 RepID=UPI000552D27A
MKKWGQLLGVLLVGLLLFTLVGCQNNGSGQTHSKTSTSKAVVSKPSRQVKRQSSSQPAKSIAAKLAAKQQASLTYVALGDSLSVGLFADSSQTDFVHTFTNLIEQQTHKPVHLVTTASVGKTVANFGLPQVNQVLAQKPDLVTIEFGTNDAVGGSDAQVIAKFKADLSQVVQTLQQNSSAQLILMTTWSPKDGEYVASDLVFDQAIQAVGQTYHVPVANMAQIWQNQADVTGPAGRALPDFAAWGTSDTFHPNQKGHDLIAKLLGQVLQQQ